MHPLLRLAAAAMLALLLLAPARAQEDAAIAVATSEARPDFPRSISFELAAEAAGADIAAVQLLYGTTRSGALTVVDLPVTPGPRVEVSHTLDTRVYYFPPGTELTYRWAITDADGDEQTTEPQTMVYHDERFSWSELSERNVTVYWYRGGADFGRELMDVTTRTLDRLQRQVGADLDAPVRIYIYADTTDMRSALQSNSVEWVGGQAHPELGIIIGAIAPGDSAEAQRLIPHELSHQVLHQATANPYGGTPIWFDEGLAVHNQEQRDIGWDEMVAEAAVAGTLIPLEALAGSFPADTERALLSYAQSRDVVEFIVATYGEGALRELVAAFAAATPADEALPAVLGVTVDELDAAWRATLPPQTGEPPTVAGPQSAPPERFEDRPPPDPALGQGAGIGLAERLAALPAWASVAALALCCVALAG
ncbi:MAG TPA: peptidase MA family metallohydrolase, partial [Chloroflexaceae bacterium]|nr:peptidase MA family metallohydrolase [Chloroflexaceae bacterium]